MRRTWAEFDDRAARLASVLPTRGVGQGSKVGLMLHNSPQFLECFFGALKIRAAPSNVDFRYTADEPAYLPADSQGDLTLLGRGSTCVNAAGEKVHPEEVEEILKPTPR